MPSATFRHYLNHLCCDDFITALYTDKMSLEGLQERLVALQETTTQLKELIDRLANLKFQPGSVPLGTEEETSVSGELSAEISLILRNGLEDQQLLSEEVKYLRPDGHEKKRLEEGIERVASDLYM